MGKISEKSSRFRSKETICNDLANVLNSDLSYGTKFAVVSDITWVWSEFNGKHQGCEYWSEDAINSNLPNSKLVHEHLVPKKILIDKPFNEVEKTPSAIHAFLSKYCIGVVITKAEDMALNSAGLRSTMPENWRDDPWIRYKHVGINVIHQKT